MYAINHMRRGSQQITAVVLFDLLAPLENQQMLAHLQTVRKESLFLPAQDVRALLVSQLDTSKIESCLLNIYQYQIN
jgi:hypothetical protein